LSERANLQKVCKAIISYSQATGIDPYALAAIGWIETGEAGTGLPFRAPQWKSGFNFGNLGITGDESQNAAAQKWDSPEDGVAAAAAHLVAYAYGKNWRQAWDVDALGDPTKLDKRFDLAVANTPDRAGVRTLGDLNRRWAIDRDDDYGGKLAERATKLATAVEAYRAKNPPVTTPSTPEEPVPTQRDPYDIIRDYVVDAWVYKEAPGHGYSAGNRNIVGLRQHETQGIMTGPQRRAFFSCPDGERHLDALVDYGIPRNEKKIYVFQNPFTSNRIPYASGGSAAAITQLAVRASKRMGNPYGGVNAFYAAVENELEHGQRMTDDQIELNARLLAYIWAMNDYPVNDAMYPDSLDNEVQTSGNHSDLYTSTNCRIVQADRDKFEAMALVFLADFYAGTDGGPIEPPKPQYAPPAIITALTPYMDADPNGVPAIVRANGSDWIFVNDRVTVARGTTPRLQRADPNALRVGDDLKKGETFTAKFMVRADAGDYYYLTAMFTRVQVKHTARLSDTV
jgi:hypothetical protein